MTTAPAAKPAAAKDNLLGICNALGNDFGFNPLWLRLALGAAFVVQPLGVVISYLPPHARHHCAPRPSDRERAGTARTGQGRLIRSHRQKICPAAPLRRGRAGSLWVTGLGRTACMAALGPPAHPPKGGGTKNTLSHRVPAPVHHMVDTAQVNP